MKKEQIREMIPLAVYGELSDAERTEFEAAIKKYPDLRQELEVSERFASLVTRHTPDDVKEGLLQDARTQLRSALRKERGRVPFAAKVKEWFAPFLHPSVAVAAVAAVVIGIIIGRATMPGHRSILPVSPVNHVSSKDHNEESNRTLITNIRFIDSDASDGEIEFEFNAVAPMHVKGKVDDPEIQRLLTHALLNESNAGVRLATLSAISERSAAQRSVDPSVRTTLIRSLKEDQNPGVRREALRVLEQYGFDAEVRDALIFVIGHDKNAGIRVAAINALQAAKMDGKQFDESSVNKLKEQISREQNSYIRNRTVNLVKEIYQ